MTADQALVCQRFLSDGALAMVWGAGGLQVLAAGHAAQGLGQQLRLLLLTSAGVAFLAATSALPLETMLFADDWRAASSLAAMGTVATQTVTGLSVVAEASICLLLFAAVLADCRRISVVLAGAALLVTVTRGHPNESAIRMGVTGLHVLSACAWVGALVGFLRLLPMGREPAMRGDALTSMRRFSLVGHIAVATTLLSGLASSLMILGRIPLNPGSPYETKLWAKFAATLLMMGLAVFNRYWAMGRCRSCPRLAILSMTSATSAEIVLGVCALGLVASLGLDDPT